MNNLDLQYKTLCETILNHGFNKSDRTGTGTKSIFGYTIRHNMQEGFPLITTKKMTFKNIASELLWFLRGHTNIKPLVDEGNYIWVGDAYKRYESEWMLENPAFSGPYSKMLGKLEFIEQIKTNESFADIWGELGPIYGKQWRNWESIKPTGTNKCEDPSDGRCYWTGYDQIAKLIYDLKTNPDSRRLMVNSWNVADIPDMVLPPCHYGFQVYTRELSLEERIKYAGGDEFFTSMFAHASDELHVELLDNANIPKRAISLMWNQRSVDTPLGLPFNIASYGLLLTILAHQTNYIPDKLIGALGDCHIYNNQVEYPVKLK